MSNREKDKRFGEVGIELGFFTREDFNRATLLQKTDEAIGVNKPIGAYLLNENKVTKQQIEKIVAIEDKFEQPAEWHSSRVVIRESALSGLTDSIKSLMPVLIVGVVIFVGVYVSAYFSMLRLSQDSVQSILKDSSLNEVKVTSVSLPFDVLFMTKSVGTAFIKFDSHATTIDFETIGHPLVTVMVKIPVASMLKLQALNMMLPDKAKSEIPATNLSRPTQPVTSVAEKSIKKSGYRKDTRLVDVSFVCNDQKFEFTRVPLFKVTYEFSTPIEVVADGDLIIELINKVASTTPLVIDREKTRRRFEDEICFNSASNKLVVQLATKE